MIWQEPGILMWLWALPLLVGLRVWSFRRRRRIARSFADETMLRRLMPLPTVARAVQKTLLMVVAAALLIIALARPRFGEYYENVTARGVDLFVLLDVSRSMDARDVVPSRLERAKSDIKDVLGKLKGDRVGLITFAGAAVVKVPLTNDLAYFRQILDELDTNSAPVGGSLIGDAIRKSLASMENRRDRDQVLLLITDGEDHDSFPREAAKVAAERGVKIFTVGLGDAKDGMRVPMDKNGQREFMQFDGQDVWSKLDDGLLRDLAVATGGAYVSVGIKSFDLGEFYQQQFSELNRGEYRTAKRKRFHEQYQWFLFAGIFLLLCDWLLAETPASTEKTNSSKTSSRTKRKTNSPLGTTTEPSAISTL